MNLLKNLYDQYESIKNTEKGTEKNLKLCEDVFEMLLERALEEHYERSQKGIKSLGELNEQK